MFWKVITHPPIVSIYAAAIGVFIWNYFELFKEIPSIGIMTVWLIFAVPGWGIAEAVKRAN